MQPPFSSLPVPINAFPHPSIPLPPVSALSPEPMLLGAPFQRSLSTSMSGPSSHPHPIAVPPTPLSGCAGSPPLSSLNSLLLQLLEAKIAGARASPFVQNAPISMRAVAVPDFHTTNLAKASTPSENAAQLSPQVPSTQNPSCKEPAVALFPRKKSGLSPRGQQDAVVVDRRALAALYHLPLKQAAKELGICPTAIKAACRKLGLPKWPYRTIRKQARRSMLAARARGSPRVTVA